MSWFGHTVGSSGHEHLYVINKEGDGYAGASEGQDHNHAIKDFLVIEAKDHGHALDRMMDGFEVEKEHTQNNQIRLKIARDHLRENPDYYFILKTVGL